MGKDLPRGANQLLKHLGEREEIGELEVRSFLKTISWSEMHPKSVERRVLGMKKMFKALLGEEFSEEIASIVQECKRAKRETQQLQKDEVEELVGSKRRSKGKRKRGEEGEGAEERVLKKFASPFRSGEQVTQSLGELKAMLPYSQYLYVKVVNARMGLGVFAKKELKKGEEVCDFEGDFLNEQEREAGIGELRQCGIGEEYMMDIKWRKGRVYTLDPTHPKHGFGRLINHSSKNANLVLKMQANYRQPRKTRFYFVARRKIWEGEELLWNYDKSKKVIHFD